MTFDIGTVKKKLLEKYPYFGSITASIEFQESEDAKAIESDGMTIYYDPEYMEGLSDNDLIFTLAHEICHIAFNHILRSEGKDPHVWKIATDAVINQLLKKDGLDIIGGGVDIPEAISYDAEQFYEILIQDKLEIDLVDGNIDDGHAKWEDAVDQHRQEERRREDELLEELKNIQELIEEREDNEKDYDVDDLASIPKVESQAGNAVRQDVRDVGDIGKAGPIIDWRLILRDTINYGVDWSFTNAIIEDGIVRPTLKEQPMPETEIVLDTSWSVEEDLLRNFLRECKNILLNSKLKVGCFDTQFYGFQEIRTEDDIEKMEFEGGGGTDFDVAVEAFSLRVDNRIVFTDGEAPMPKEPLDAIWMVYGEKAIEPRGGRVIHITPEQLEQLKNG